jgi:hypothetical protein
MSYDITAEVRKGMKRDYKRMRVEVVDANPPAIELE